MNWFIQCTAQHIPIMSHITILFELLEARVFMISQYSMGKLRYHHLSILKVNPFRFSSTPTLERIL